MLPRAAVLFSAMPSCSRPPCQFSWPAKSSMPTIATAAAQPPPVWRRALWPGALALCELAGLGPTGGSSRAAMLKDVQRLVRIRREHARLDPSSAHWRQQRSDRGRGGNDRSRQRRRPISIERLRNVILVAGNQDRAYDVQIRFDSLADRNRLVARNAGDRARPVARGRTVHLYPLGAGTDVTLSSLVMVFRAVGCLVLQVTKGAA